jgi:PDZ domain-containing secreted protein
MIGNPHDTFECFPVSQAAEAVWEQIKDQKPKTKDEIIHSFANSWESYGTYDHIVDWKECQKEAKRRAPELAKEFLDKAKKKFVYQVEFSDDSSFGSTMEHGDVFRNIDHKRFNNH